jgi:hypothetical protein
MTDAAELVKLADVRDAMLEMGPQVDPVREYLRRMLAEFGDQHYHTCPSDNDSGPCDCFAGALVKDATAALAAQQDGARFTAAELNLIRQWYNAVCDANPEYLDDTDKALGKKITEQVRRDEQSPRRADGKE